MSALLLLAIFASVLSGSYMNNITVEAEKVTVNVPPVFTTKVIEKNNVARDASPYLQKELDKRENADSSFVPYRFTFSSKRIEKVLSQ